jgi:hypothetical protein
MVCVNAPNITATTRKANVIDHSYGGTGGDLERGHGKHTTGMGILIMVLS